MVKWSGYALLSSDPSEPIASRAQRTTSACRSLICTAIDDTTRVVEDLLQSARNPTKAIRENFSHVQGSERKDDRKEQKKSSGQDFVTCGRCFRLGQRSSNQS